MNKLLMKLSHMILKLEEIKADKGILVVDGALEEGKEIFILDTNEELIVPEDGEYIAEDGRTIKIAEGRVLEIVNKENEEEIPEGDTKEPDEQLAEEDTQKIADLEAEIARLQEENARLQEENAALQAQLEEAKGKEEELQKQLQMSADQPLKDKEQKENTFKPTLRIFS